MGDLVRCLCFIIYLLFFLDQHFPFYWLVLINSNVLNFHFLYPKHDHSSTLWLSRYWNSPVLSCSCHSVHTLTSWTFSAISVPTTSHAAHFPTHCDIPSAGLFSWNCSAKVYNKLCLTETRGHCQYTMANISEASDTWPHPPVWPSFSFYATVFCFSVPPPLSFLTTCSNLR